jgi:hypothetical protein
MEPSPFSRRSRILSDIAVRDEAKKMGAVARPQTRKNGGAYSLEYVEDLFSSRKTQIAWHRSPR